MVTSATSVGYFPICILGCQLKKNRPWIMNFTGRLHYYVSWNIIETVIQITVKMLDQKNLKRDIVQPASGETISNQTGRLTFRCHSWQIGHPYLMKAA